MKATDTHTDGGKTIDDSPFARVSETTVSRREQYVRRLDVWILTPLRVIWDDTRTRVGFLIVLLYLLMGTVGVMLTPSPTTDNPKLIQPFTTLQYPLGTTGTGKPLLRAIIHATPPMLKMMFAGAVFAVAVGTVVGLITGYKGGLVDRVMTTLTDMVMTIPGLPLVIVIATILSPRNPYVLGIILTINVWAGLARAIRSQVLTIRENSYVEASRVLGAPTPKILREDLLPNLMPYIMINFVNAARNVIFASVGLYFLGILPFTSLNWGVMMNLAYRGSGALYTWSTMHWIVLPMLAIVFLSYGLILIAQGSDRLFNPRVRARHATTIADEGTDSETDETEMAESTGRTPW